MDFINTHYFVSETIKVIYTELKMVGHIRLLVIRLINS